MVTVVVVAVAVLVGIVYYHKLFRDPWTRDGQVRANVIGITARVSGPISRIVVRDNQRVKKGDLLLEIDPSVYRVAFEKAQAALNKDMIVHQNALDEEKRRNKLVPDGLIAQEVYQKFSSLEQEAKAQVDLSRAEIEHVRQQLEFTKVHAPADGVVTGLELGPGTYVRTGDPLFALIEIDDCWVEAYFKETWLPRIRPGDRAEVVLLGDPGRVLTGRVESIGSGIERGDGKKDDLLPRVKPTIDWIRLAQRFPVRIELDEPDPSHPLRMGETATVYIRGSHR